MSGHNKWSTIKRKKEKTDAARGKIFTRLIRELTVAAREGGGDLNSNSRLRTAVATAKTQNMPQDNITRAIKKGTGELPGVTYDEITYEGYGPGGAAILIEAMTDNKNRTTPEIRHIFAKYNGNLGAPNSVSWMFDKKAQITVSSSVADEDTLLELLLDADVEDIQLDEDIFTITLPPEQFDNAKQILEDNNIATESAELTKIPQSTKDLSEKEADSMMKILDALEENDDVQNIYTSASF